MNYDDWKLDSPPEPTPEEQRLRELIVQIEEMARSGLAESKEEYLRWKLEKIIATIHTGL